MDDFGDAPDSRDLVSDWLSRLERARTDADMAKWSSRCEVIRRKYRYEGSAFVKTRQFQLFWSTIQALRPAVYTKPPHATVTRRYNDPDPVARAAIEIMERAINFSFDVSGADDEFKLIRDDFLLYGRGVARVYYEPEYETINDKEEDIADAEDIVGGISGDAEKTLENTSSQGVLGASKPSGVAGGDKARPGESEKLAFENVRIRFVQREDFRHQPARVWDEVSWVAFRAFMTRQEVTKRFGEEIGKQIALDADSLHPDDSSHRSTGAVHNESSKATIWEIWDKAKDEVLWIAKGWPEVLEEGGPYLVLDGFFPCPRPAYSTLTPDSLVPVPDYIYIQDQLEEIDQLTARVGALSDALKFVGFYPAGPQGEGSPEIEKAFSAGFENKMIAVQSWSAFVEGGGGKGPPIVFLPVEQVMTILEGCVKLRQQLVEDVFQISGLSDIMRGATDPQETEGAQQLKAQYGGVRIRDRQQEIARFCRDIGRLTGQIIAGYFQPDTVELMTNIILPTEAEQLQEQLMAMRQASMQAQMAQQQPAQMQPQGVGGPI